MMLLYLNNHLNKLCFLIDDMTICKVYVCANTGRFLPHTELFPTLVDGRRVVCSIENKRVLPKKRKERVDGETEDPRQSRVWGKGLPIVENIVLRKEKDKDVIPKRRRVVCVLGGKRVERVKKESL